jgi:hypothetical protein
MLHLTETDGLPPDTVRLCKAGLSARFVHSSSRVSVLFLKKRLNEPGRYNVTVVS